jgi:hypothetical protein
MNVNRPSVTSGAQLIGRMIRKKIRMCPAPSIRAASSISRLMPSRNCRMKNTANGVMNNEGRMMPA